MSNTTDTKATVPTMSAALVKRFISAYRSDTKSVATKARAIGEAIKGGATNGAIVNQLRIELESNGFVVPKSFSASVTHYATAYSVASQAGVATDDNALHAAYQISTGVVKASVRTAAIEAFKGDAEAFVKMCRELLSEAKAAKATASAPLISIKDDGEVEEADAPDEDLSVLSDFKRTLRQLTAQLDLLAQSDGDDYTEALAEFSSLAALYAV